uniref:SH2 domain-containing protein n=1 Tax=Anopheles melas TaxID=34690 RepID=A0A182UBF1_9DIPT
MFSGSFLLVDVARWMYTLGAMSCCCLVVSYHLIVNLVDRFSEVLRDLVYCRCRRAEQFDDCEVTAGDSVEPTVQLSAAGVLTNKPRYVVINDTVELEPFYYDIDRRYCELLLRDRPAGTCIVRPFKLKHETIRYILSIRAPDTYFHLFIRHAGKNGMYALGLEKEQEKRFKFPTDIVRYYQAHLLECSRASRVCTKLQLQPLPISDVLEARRPNAPAKTT